MSDCDWHFCRVVQLLMRQVLIALAISISAGLSLPWLAWTVVVNVYRHECSKQHASKSNLSQCETSALDVSRWLHWRHW